MCLSEPNPWPHASGESPLDNEAEMKAERRSRGKRVGIHGRKRDERKRNGWMEVETERRMEKYTTASGEGENRRKL